MNDPALARTIIGDSPAVRELRRLVLQAAPLSLPVLIEGPTGSGKELVAQALHGTSKRPGPCVAVNVCAIAETMFEDALFGHVRGAFTGASHDTGGYLAEAHHGTIFLDEIGSLPLPLQGKLLRVVETGEFRPVGAGSNRRSDFRVLAATNESLAGLVGAGSFRPDLAYRLAGITLNVPPLADRLEDVPALVQHFADLAAGHAGAVQFTRGAIRALQSRPWPGNVRQLRHLVERAVAFCDHTVLDRTDVEQATKGAHATHRSDAHEFARRRLIETLERCGWDTARAAALLGVHRATVYRRMQRLGVREAPAHGQTGTDTWSPGEVSLHSHS